MRILLVDDHALFRDGVALLLEGLVKPTDVVHAASVAEAVAATEADPALDLVLLDLVLPGESGLGALAMIRERRPDLPVVMLSSQDDSDTVMRALELGAMGFIPKSAPSTQMLHALRIVLARGVYVPPAVQASGPLPVRQPEGSPHAADAPRTSAMTPADLGLTPRQGQVLYLILQGKPIKLISRALGLSDNTTKTHVSAVLRALNVTTRTQAIVVASRLHLVFDDVAR